MTNDEQVITTTNAPVQDNTAPPTDSTNINVEQFVNETNQEIGNEQAVRKARDEKKLLLSKATKSLNRTSNNIVLNVETNEVIGEYLVYLPDNDGKTVYDYMKDPEVSKHIQFVFPDGQKEGDKLTAPITPCWIDPTF